MELHEALSQISEIRLQMARTEVFRGYRAMPVAFSGALALLSSFIQAAWIPEPTSQLTAYLSLWVSAALLSAFAAGTEMVIRSRRPDSSWSRRITWLAVEQFVPCLVAGGLLVLVRVAPEGLWMLPGLWQILFSLGVFASCRLLPKATFWIAVFYLAAGLITLTWARGDAALSPWAMGLPFGIGQFFAAIVLYRTLESEMLTHDTQGDDPAGRFAYDGLERIFHEKARLGIMTSLVTHPEGLLFNDLKDLCALTDGNLSRHLQALHEAGYVDVWKGVNKNRSQTLYRLTTAGQRRFLDYITVLESVVSDALAAKDIAATGKKLSERWSTA